MENARLLHDGDPIAAADALIEMGGAWEAVRLLERAHEERCGGLLLSAARVRACIAAGRIEGALEIAREAVHLYPGVAQAAVALGDALLAADCLPAAIGEFQRASRLDPDLVPARYGLGRAWLEAGEAEKAAEAFARIPPNAAFPGLADKLAEIDRMRGLRRADPRYVRHLFDQFSSDYDFRMLGELRYRGPQILRALADMLGLGMRGRLVILDLGCGTGLAGAAFRDIASCLRGIDLSPHMAAKALARGVYDEVTVADIETGLSDAAQSCDLIVAADTLVYLGDLAPMFHAAAGVLSPCGAFLFTVEGMKGEGYELGPKRRWRHSESYLRAEARRAGFDMAGLLECEPRTECALPVEGFAVALNLTRAGDPAPDRKTS